MPTIEQIPQLPLHTKKHWQEFLIDSLLALGGALLVTAVIYAYHLYPTIPNISIIYLLVILLLASTRGRFAALVAAVASFLAFDFFLVPPLYTFTIARWQDWIALFVFLVTALLTSHLTTVSQQSAEQARLRAREARILYEAGRVINSSDRLADQLDSIVLSLVRVFSPWGLRECALLLPTADGALSILADAPIRIESFTLSPDEMAAAREAMALGKMRDIDQAAASQALTAPSLLRLVPLKRGDRVLGVLCLRVENGQSWFASDQLMLEEQEQAGDQSTFFWTFLDQAIMVIERARLRDGKLANNEG
jgi:K+-sensing histidine kinase KdpD